MSILQSDQIRPEILAVRTVAQTAVFEIQSVDLRFSNGTQRTYERLTPARRPAVMVLPIENNELIMIREYAVGTERHELTCVKGLIDAGEMAAQAANRELQEEIGHGANHLTFVRELYSSPSHMYSPMHVFIAQDLYPSVLQGDEPEPLQIVRLSLSDLDDLIGQSEMGDARVLSALMLLQRWLRS
ncbi:ADP compounds hydrolase NudE [Kingella kingae]|uniref:ADP compounds hydrolase NudE n=1 Tax=Kingella kingae TaxID=504 RepID=UPI0003FFCAFC|nr:ADP compounds hydrolase NudE [Kingella kingae]MDK4565530.1 ADP compounds hydrolase NudE [Kingella kingae]MDK4577742.1 ADP compounds hydrolase NudE [Kingella kingae]MDK4608472.1 ADP compounds hydrolase NudE [Kingella kingae]MDK4626373.1 ADP compounds hydrolase NudE [Kingella kingae]MDK4674168.1 ADP compounds hydrolase NudE [Kingella kingae]